jgi:NADH dehydrogenase [ubiquinone] 1 alpha subcomplex assembly factor 6
MANTDAALSYCGQEVHRGDRERFLTCLFAPPDRREALFGLYAFNIEVAKTREVVTEPLLGQIRLQWWREAVEEMYAGSVRRHEVVKCLAEAVEAYGLTRGYFDELIDAREADLEEEEPATLADLERYAEQTGAPLVLLALQALGVPAEGAAAEAGRHVGMAWALTGLLRAVSFHARSHRIYLPRELLERHGMTRHDVFELRPHPGLPAVVRAVAESARVHLAAARAARKGVPRRAVPALLTATLADGHLSALAGAGYDPLDPRLQAPRPLTQVMLALRAFAGRY